MRAATAFELDVTPGRGERVALAAIGGLCAAALSSWAWSHVDAAAGPMGHGPWPWIGTGLGAAVIGALIGWTFAPRSAGMLAWRQGQWTLQRPPDQARTGELQAKLDAGSWMLLCFRPTDGGTVSWLAVSRRAGGPAWHALRATLFAPGAPDRRHDPGGDARS
ncbi:MAG TPA: hypothetical protein VFU71_13840 [Burkholderiaceae bacterium]|nr:hypothetical protein [Burkholderiaceae bacterium]